MPIENVLSIQQNYLKSSSPGVRRQIDPNHFTIHYAEKSTGDKWVYKNLTLKHLDAMQVASWVKTLQNHLLSRYNC